VTQIEGEPKPVDEASELPDSLMPPRPPPQETGQEVREHRTHERKHDSRRNRQRPPRASPRSLAYTLERKENRRRPRKPRTDPRAAPAAELRNKPMAATWASRVREVDREEGVPGGYQAGGQSPHLRSSLAQCPKPGTEPLVEHFTEAAGLDPLANTTSVRVPGTL